MQTYPLLKMNLVIMLVNIYCKLSLFSAHTMILTVHIFMNVNKLCLNPKRCNMITLRSFQDEPRGVALDLLYARDLFMGYTCKGSIAVVQS